VCGCGTGSDVYSPQRQQSCGISSENPTINGSPYTLERPQHHDVQYVSSQEQNGTQADDRYSQHVGAMPPLCSLRELDMSSARSDDESNAKQVVKSLLRAMLAKPRPSDVSSIMEMSTKNEFDSGSEDTMEHAALGADGKDDDSQSANDTAARDDSAAIESESEAQTTGQAWTSESDVQTTGQAWPSETDLQSTGQGWPSSAHSSPEKASRCPYCLKMFRYRSSYRRHVKIHEGIFSHECTICLRKFTRKEHYVRHKCDRRPNKPYNITHDAFRRMSASQKAAARQLVKSSLVRDAVVQSALDTTTDQLVKSSFVRDAVVQSALGRFDNCATTEQLDAPLELTCQSSGRQLDVPKLLFTGGSVSTVAPMSLDCTTYSISSTNTSSSNAAQSSDSIAGNAMQGLDTGLLLHSESVSGNAMRGLDAGVLIHNESRRKSSTPRKVVSTEADVNGTSESDSCRLNVPARLNNLSSVPLSVIE